jgi:hypothetical protein
VSGLPEREDAGRSIIDDQTAGGIRQKRSIGFYEGLAMLSDTAANESRCLGRSLLYVTHGALAHHSDY